MNVIDTHVHAWEPTFIPPAVRMSWAEGAVLRRDGAPGEVDDVYSRVTHGVTDPEGRHLLAAMALAGVDHAILIGVDYGEVDGSRASVPARVVMDRYRGIVSRERGRLSYVAGIDPRDPEAIGAARDLLDQEECVGLKIYPPAGFRPSDPICEPIYRALIAADKPAIFHTSAIRGRLYWRNSWPVYISDVQARHQDLKIVLAHSGWSCWWDECVALAANHPRTYLELSLWQKFASRRPKVFAEMLSRARDETGSDRILFASDTMYGEKLEAPAREWRSWVDYMKALPETTAGDITESEVTMFCGGNAAHLFGLAVDASGQEITTEERGRNGQ